MSDKSNPEHALRGPRRDPWSVPVVVAQIPATGLHKVIVPSPQEMQAMVSDGGLLNASDIRAEFMLKPGHRDQVRVEGRVTGKVGQTCVVTLDPIDSVVDETIELIFAPAEQISAMAPPVDESADDADDRPDPPEPIENGVIDLGRIATDAIFLGLDPYPRKPGAVFAPVAHDDDPEDHPFAALKALKSDN